ncbi:MAG: peptidoglycan hydrolase CwlO-like protein [Cryomorphaceae bacterium]|jgi:peptidoglycan hydrolase CwlO-like protein
MTDSTDSNSKKLLIAVVILAITTLVLGILVFTKSQTVEVKEDAISGLRLEQLQLENDLQDMLIQYDTVTVSNSQLSAEITAQQEQIKEMLKEIDKHKDDAYIISKLKKEAGTLRDIMKGYLVTIDSLNTMNKDLIRDNDYLAGELIDAKTKTKQLESSKENLESIVATGSILQSLEMTAVGLRMRNNGTQKETNRANKTEIIRTCAKIGENRIAKAGRKTIYLRIISQDGVVLQPEMTDDQSFDFDGVSGKYTVKRAFDYTNEAADVCVFFNVPGEFDIPEGNYIVEMYEGGALIGRADFDLK